MPVFVWALFVGPGCFVCPWAAARPRAVRAASLWLGASARSPARPRHRPRAPQPGPPDPPAPSTPVGPVVLMRIHIIAEPIPNFARNSPTSLSNSEIRSLELQRFPTLLKLHPIELRATFLGQTRNTHRPPHLKPMTPLRSPWRTRLKPLTPLLAQNSQFQAIFRPQRCHGFHAPLAEHPQRRCRFHPRRTLRPQPKPRVACAHATRPVAHWPHD